jgi:hypothetical protein
VIKMNKLLGAFILALPGVALAEPEVGKSDYFPLERNLAVDIRAPGAIRAEVGVSIPSSRDALQYRFELNDGRATGGVYIPPGGEALVHVAAFDEHGEKLHAGGSYVYIDGQLTREIGLVLEGDPVDPAELRIGTYLLTSELVTRDREEAVMEVSLVDGWGNHLRLTAEDIQWNWPKGFETTPYPCDRSSLCIDVPDPGVLVGSIGCIQDITCIPKN